MENEQYIQTLEGALHAHHQMIAFLMSRLSVQDFEHLSDRLNDPDFQSSEIPRLRPVLREAAEVAQRLLAHSRELRGPS